MLSREHHIWSTAGAKGEPASGHLNATGRKKQLLREKE